jgi:hypothetical protein
MRWGTVKEWPSLAMCALFHHRSSEEDGDEQRRFHWRRSSRTGSPAADISKTESDVTSKRGNPPMSS